MTKRLVPDISLESEWRYLVNETFIGERCIVPLLKDLCNHSSLTKELKAKIEQQTTEEVGHVRLYHQVIGKEKLEGSSFDKPFSTFVKKLSLITEKLFALQIMLEGIALGALEYRLNQLEHNPSHNLDQKVHRDEEGHVTYSYKFVHALRKLEGEIPRSRFNILSRDINHIFSKTFQGRSILNILKHQDMTTSISESTIDHSAAMAKFRSISLKNLAQTKASFFNHYYNHA